MGKLTIGQLARRAGLRPSALRYYEAEGLLSPDERTEAGYRLYGPEAEQTLYFIQQAQRSGFALSDIRVLLNAVQADTLSREQVVEVAEARVVDVERRLTELLVVRHELESFLLELERKMGGGERAPRLFFDRVVGQVCAIAPGELEASSILDWLIEQTHCTLGLADLYPRLAALRGQHLHVWQQEDGYDVLVVSQDPAVGAALGSLEQIEAACHAHPQPEVREHEEGFLFSARGANAFIYVRLFLALEQEERDTRP